MGSSKIMANSIDDSVLDMFKPKNVSVTLTASGWSNGSQAITAQGVTATSIVIISPSPASFDAYGKAKIKCTAQSKNSLTFMCDTSSVPTVDLTVNIVIMGV